MNNNKKAIVLLNNPKKASSILICFPWVGGNAYSYRFISRHLEEKNVQVFGINYESNSDQNSWEFSSKFDELLEEIESFIIDQILPIHLFGHSLGGLFAFEIAKKINSTKVRNILISSLKHKRTLIKNNENKLSGVFHHKKDPKELLVYIKEIGGLPIGIDEIFLKQALPRIKKHYYLFETYCGIPSQNDSKISTPITVFHGTLDLSLTKKDLIEWENETDCPNFKFIEFDGGSHFYLNDVNFKVEFLKNIEEICKI